MFKALFSVILTLVLVSQSANAQNASVNINSRVEVLSVSEIERAALEHAERIIAEALDPQIENELARKSLRERVAKIIRAIVKKAPTPTRIVQEFNRHRMLFVIEVASTGLGLGITSSVAAGILPIYWLGVAAVLGNPATTLALYSSFMAARHINKNTFQKHNLKSTLLQVLQIVEGWKYSLMSPLQERAKVGFFLSRYLTTSVVEEMNLTIPVIRSRVGNRLRLNGAPVITDKELIEIVRSVYPNRVDFMLQRLNQAEVSYDLQIEALVRALRLDPKLRSAFLTKLSHRVDFFMNKERTAEVDFFVKSKRISNRMTQQEKSVKEREAEMLDWLSQEKTQQLLDKGLSPENAKKRVEAMKDNVRSFSNNALEGLALTKLNFVALTRAYLDNAQKRDVLQNDMNRLAEKALKIIRHNRGSRTAMRCLMAGG